MARRKRNQTPQNDPLIPERTAEGREQQMINLAMNLVEQRLLDGTASSAETVHFLKLATERDKLEREKMEAETELVKAKSRAVDSMEDNRKLFKEAIQAMKDYRGLTDDGDYNDSSE